MNLQQVLAELKANANPRNVEGMARFGINPKNTLGISVPFLRSLAKKIGKDHELAIKLWKTKIHEARLLAAFIDDFKQVTKEQMESWVKEFDSWDVCDQVVMNLFDKTPAAYKTAVKWSKDKREFVKRAGFAMMAALSVHDKKAKDAEFIKLLPVIKREAKDGRNFVRKAVNWALRQIGKRNSSLRKAAIRTSKEILKLDSKAAKWIANDAIRELMNRA